MRVLLAGIAAAAMSVGVVAADRNTGNGPLPAPAASAGGATDKGPERQSETAKPAAQDAKTVQSTSAALEDKAPRGAVQAAQGAGSSSLAPVPSRKPDRSAMQRIAAAGDRVGNSVMRTAERTRFIALDAGRKVVAGCPPGLAQQRNGCALPGNATGAERSLYGGRYSPHLFGLAHYRDGIYRYVDGFLIRQGTPDRPAGWIPLPGGALSPGKLWPDGYLSVDLPAYLIDYFDLGEGGRYRFADNVIYRVSEGGTAITAIAALLTGDRFLIGAPMPSGYEIYNVPLPYRDRFPDQTEVTYRYCDGRIYGIDPVTGLVKGAHDVLS